MIRRLLALALVLSFAAAPALSAADDGFAAFWRVFATDVGKDDQAALKGLVQLGPGIGDQTTFAQVHADYLKPTQRRCLAKAHPVRGVDGTGVVNYSAFCGQLVYVFSKTVGGWKLTDLSPDD